MVALLREMFERGELVGVLAEPNPVLERAVERRRQGEEPAAGWTPRWVARDPDGAVLRSELRFTEGEGRGATFLKCGLPCSEADALSSFGDRTYLVGETRERLTPVDEGAATFGQRLFSPVAFDPGENLWEQLALDGAGESARRCAKELLVARLWRRIGLWHSLAPWRGCGLARWDFTPLKGKEGAAGRALAALQATGDVVARSDPEKGQVVLEAIFLAREEGGGERAVREVARQWELQPERWQPLVFDFPG